jgi:hypothetical protein
MNGDDLEERVDVVLTDALVPPRLSPAFRASLLRRVDESPHSLTSDALPDILHLAGGAALTALAVSIAPASAPMVVAVGTMATAASYFALVAVRNSLDETA